MFIFLRMDLNIQLPKMSSCSPFTCFSWPWAICQMITSPSPRQANPRFSIIDHLISFHILGHSSHSVAFGQLQCGFAEKELQSHGNPNYSPQKVEHQKGGLNKALLRGNGGYIIAIYCWTLNSGWGIFAQVVRIPMTKTCKNALRDLTSGQKYLMVSPASLNPLGTPQRQNARSAHPDDKKNCQGGGRGIASHKSHRLNRFRLHRVWIRILWCILSFYRILAPNLYKTGQSCTVW